MTMTVVPTDAAYADGYRAGGKLMARDARIREFCNLKTIWKA